MSEQFQEKTVFTLTEVSNSIRKTLSDRYSSAFWVKAEMNKLNHYSHSGHCYPELVEKSGTKVTAQLKAILWKDDYLRINKNFLSLLNEPLKDGIKILFLARITFEPVYGLSLHILDIDASFTLGDLEREKKETIEKLRHENIFGHNKTLAIAALPQRLAIISVETSKGYADFLQVIDRNSFGYAFFHMLFPALLQGEKAVDSIIAQLDRIRKVTDRFDAVAIIRGGGGDVGLSCYNHYRLAKAIATFPLPVLTGIGHATNETVSEMVSFRNEITPTRLGEFLIQKFHDFAVPVQRSAERLAEVSKRMLTDEKSDLQSEMKLFRSVTDQAVAVHRNDLSAARLSMRQQTQFIMTRSHEQLRNFREKISSAAIYYRGRHQSALEQLRSKLQERTHAQLAGKYEKLDYLAQHVSHLDPVNVLRRGYSITYYNGKAVREIDGVDAGAVLETKVYDGVIKSTVNTTSHGREN